MQLCPLFVPVFVNWGRFQIWRSLDFDALTLGRCSSSPTRIRDRVRLLVQRAMLAIIRVLKPKIGMGLQALKLDSVSNQTFLQWLDVLSESR